MFQAADTASQVAPSSSERETVHEFQWQGLRLVVAYDKLRAQEQSSRRDEQIAELEQQANLWVGKLNAQEGGSKKRGRKLSDGGVRARLYHAVCEAHLSHIIRVDLKSERLSYHIDDKALELARSMDGKLLLVSNAQDLSTNAIVDVG